MPKESKARNQNLTIPNALSVLRVLVVPFFAYFFLKGDLPLAAGVLVLSGLSDLFDGVIARKFNQITELGKILDPLADKLTQGVVALCLAIRYPIVCPVLGLFVVKELMMLVGACVLLKRQRKPGASKWYGKVSTVLFYIAVSIIVIMDGFFHPTPLVFNTVSYVLLGLTAVMMLYSGWMYFRLFREILHSNDQKHAINLPDEIRAKTVRKGK